MGVFWGVVGFLVIFAYGIAQLTAGFLGIEHTFGAFWAWSAIVATFIFRFSLLISIAAFFGAKNVWGWDWWWAALFACPGLLLVVPGMLASVFNLVKR